jgi:hypothetical protein
MTQIKQINTDFIIVLSAESLKYGSTGNCVEKHYLCGMKTDKETLENIIKNGRYIT